MIFNKPYSVRGEVLEPWTELRHSLQGEEDDDTNVLCLSARVIGSELANEVVKAWLSASFSKAERHCRRLEKIEKIERGGKG